MGVLQAGRPFALLEGNKVLHSIIARENMKEEKIFSAGLALGPKDIFWSQNICKMCSDDAAPAGYRSSEFHLPGQNGCRTALKEWPQWEFTGLLYGRNLVKGGICTPIILA